MFVTNAVIESASLTTDDHDILSMWLHLNYGSSGQGFGGYVLCVSPDSPHWPGEGNVAGVFIRRVLDIAGVTDFAKLKGRTIRVRKDKEWGTIQAIGHIVKDKWFDPEAEFAAMRAKAEAA